MHPKSYTHVRPIAAGAGIGHVHLKVAEIERSLDFYCGVLGFSITQRVGRSAAFIAAGGYHHHIGLNKPTWTAACARHHRPVSPRDSLPQSRRSR